MLDVQDLRKSFDSLALPDGDAGPLFTARLAIGPGSVSIADDFALYGVGRDGVLRELLREGKPLLGKMVKGFEILKAVPGSTGAARGYAANAQAIALVTFDDATTGIVRITLL